MNGNEKQMRKTIFVGNLDYKTTPAQLRQFFRTYGHARRVHFIRDKSPSISQRSAFVTFANSEEASAVLDASISRMVLNKKVLKVARSTVRKIIPKTKDKSVSTEVVENPALKSPFEMVGLCEDILPNILCYLSVEDLLSAEKVCRYWHRVALKVWSLKTSLRFGQHGSRHRITQHDFKKLMRRCGRSLIEIDAERITPLLEMNGIQHIVTYCSKLESLTLADLTLTNEALDKLAGGLPELRKIVLLKCKRFTENGFLNLFEKCRKLEYIHISSNDKITGECFGALGPNVHELLLCDCFRINGEGFTEIGWMCLNLQTLCLDSCAGLTVSRLTRIYGGCQEIKKLNLRNINYFVLMETNLDHLKFFTFLVDLNVSANVDFSDAHMSTVAQFVIKLKRLDVSDCPKVTDDGVFKLVRCPELVYLNISHLHLLIGDTLGYLSKKCPLEEIICKGCVNVNVKYLVELIKNCPLLRLLDVTDCTSVSHWLIDAAHLVILQNRSLLGPMLRIVVPGTKAAAGNEDKRFYHRFLEIDASP